ncbi:MAG: MotA/TolQ/ExbB proton channel family protein [Gammaproteobacteria bacterium]|nr:MotA/TolQ/ExbB proton channel family protein [Gammaproteobacteria bacterium]
MDTYTSVTTFFQSGGTFMYPIALVLIIGMAIAIERWVFLKKALFTNQKAYRELLPLLTSKNMMQIQEYANNSRSAIARILLAAVETMQTSPRRDDIQSAMQEGILETVPRLSRRTNYLSVLANIATLLGLLGTIIGLIAAFTAVAQADPAEKATLLSESISVAMNTTAFGLMAAIPLLLIHSLLQNKTVAIVDSIEMAGLKFLNTMVKGRQGAVTRTSDA